MSEEDGEFDISKAQGRRPGSSVVLSGVLCVVFFLLCFVFLEKERSSLVCCWGNMGGEEKMKRSLGIFNLSTACH